MDGTPSGKRKCLIAIVGKVNREIVQREENPPMNNLVVNHPPSKSTVFDSSMVLVFVNDLQL